MTKIDGVVEIKTDVPGRLCTFKVPPQVEYKTKLAEFAKTNSHLRGYSIE